MKSLILFSPNRAYLFFVARGRRSLAEEVKAEREIMKAWPYLIYSLHIFYLFLKYVHIHQSIMNRLMDEAVEHQFNQRLRRQLVYPFSEIEYLNKMGKIERQDGGSDMVEVIERAEDGRLLSIKEVSEIHLPKNPKNPEENTD